MNHPQSFRAWHRPVAIILALLLLICNFTLTQAQDVAPPVLRIVKVDTTQFPDVKVYVFGQNLGQNLGEVDLSVKQDGVDQVVTSSEMADVGAQVALLIDASLDIRKPGCTGDPRFTEVSNVVIRLVERPEKVFSSQTDWLAAFAPTADDTIQPIKDWTRDHGGLRNDLFLYEPPKDIKETPLFKLIYKGLDAFADPKLDPTAQRAVVLFSDGLAPGDPLKIDDAIARANELGIPIHTVLFCPGAGNGPANLERLALKTGGQFVKLSSIDVVDPVWDQIAGGRQQRVLSYRSRTADPSQITVVAQLAEGTVENSTPINPPPPPVVQIAIQQPTSGQEVIRSGDAYNTPLAELTPAVLPIQVAFTWPDGPERALQRVEYSLDNDTRVVEAPPFDRIDFPIDKLGDGNHTVRVQAIDDFGRASQAEPVGFTVQVVTPTPPPTPVPTPPPPNCDTNGDGICTGLEGPIGVFRENALTFAALALALIALLFAIIVLVRKPTVRGAVTEALSGTIKAVTQPFALDRKMRGQQAAKARLVLVEGNANVPPIIEIHSSNTRIGRDSSLSNVVIDDPRVSRYHCRIAEEADGSYRVFDEGSTSGTYVNYEPVPISGQYLQDGDQIHIGPVGLRFELIKPDQGAREDSSKTEPYVPQFGQTVEDDPFKTEPFKIQPPDRKSGQ